MQILQLEKSWQNLEHWFFAQESWESVEMSEQTLFCRLDVLPVA